MADIVIVSMPSKKLKEFQAKYRKLQAENKRLKERITEAHEILNSWGRNKSDSLIYKTLLILRL